MKNNTYRLSEYDETVREILESGGRFRIYPKGTSMLPLIRQGIDSVSLMKPENGIKIGDIVFYLRDNGEYVLHRVIKAENRKYTLCGDNQITAEKNIEDRHIIGIAETIYRGEKMITQKNFFYRLYLFLWRSFFIRRVFIKLRTIFGRKNNENIKNR